jgi:hypothetical protein
MTSQGKPKGDSRLVIFVGPHKSASSSIQEFFIRHAHSPKNTTIKQENINHPSLVNWTWPYVIRRRMYQSRKGFAPLVTEFEDSGWEEVLHETILDVWNTSQSKQLILGTEELDRFGKTPWSHRDGLTAIQKLIQLLHPDKVDIVLNYRRPRSHQWISIWKQLTRREKTTPAYGEYLCRRKEYDMLWEYLDCVANPIGLANALAERFGSQATIHILDMQGVEAADLDVSHVLTCDILGDVPCSDGWVEGMEHPQRLNQKFGNPGITQHQLEEMEWFFIQRDCAFQKALANQSNLQVHYGDTIWEHCNDPHPGFGNTTLLLELLQSQVGCGGTDSNTIIQKLLKLPRSEGSSEQKSIGTQKKMVKAIKTTVTASTGSILSDGNNNDWMQNAIKTQIFTLLASMIVFICFLVRRIKWKGEDRRNRF